MSRHDIAPWLLQDIGVIGCIIIGIYLLQIVAGIFFKNSKAYNFVQNVRIGIFNQFIIDFIGLTLRTLGHACYNAIDQPLKITSFVFAIFLITCFLLEMIYAYN